MFTVKKYFNSSQLYFPFLIVILFSCSVQESINYKLGLESYNQNKYITAIDYFNQAVLEDPFNPVLYLQG